MMPSKRPTHDLPHQGSGNVAKRDYIYDFPSLASVAVLGGGSRSRCPGHIRKCLEPSCTSTYGSTMAEIFRKPARTTRSCCSFCGTLAEFSVARQPPTWPAYARLSRLEGSKSSLSIRARTPRRRLFLRPMARRILHVSQTPNVPSIANLTSGGPR